MDRKTIIKKKRILSRISLTQYRELLSFVEEFYLADYSLKILIARKGSNLFSALIDLVREEDGGRVQQLYEKKFSEKKEPTIISDRALDYYVEDIQNGRYKSIMIADDTIRHGKTIAGLHEKIQELLSKSTDDSDVRLCAFAACQDDMPKELRSGKMDIKHYVNLGEYRKISDMVIDILPLSGQPYTSYIPNVTLQKESPLYQPITAAMQTMTERFMDYEEQKKLDLHSAVWISPETPDYAMFQSIRFYLYDDLQLCTLVPMVSFMPTSDNSLSEYGKILKDVIDESYYEKVFFRCCELSYRTIIYAVSSLILRQFIRRELQYQGKLYDLEDQKEERLNFGAQILNQQKLNEMSLKDISEILESLKTKYQKIEMEEIQELDTDIKELRIEVSQRFSNTPSQHVETGNLVKRFFTISGDWNENIWKKAVSQKKPTPKSSCDYPFICLADQITRTDCDPHEFYVQILRAIDYGRGAIVAREKWKEGKPYYLPLLTAGERNYKYKQEKYFSFLYGLLEIEQKAAKKAIEPHPYKAMFWEQYPKDQFIEQDQEELKTFCDTDITAQYKPVLLNDVWSYPNGEELSHSMALADEIMQ